MNKRYILIGIPLTLLCLILPFPIWISESPLALASYGTAHIPFELLGFACILPLAILMTLRFWKKKITISEAAPWLLALVTTSFWVAYINEHAQSIWDYKCYTEAADALMQGSNLFTHCYIYPPMIAQILAALYQDRKSTRLNSSH